MLPNYSKVLALFVVVLSLGFMSFEPVASSTVADMMVLEPGGGEGMKQEVVAGGLFDGLQGLRDGLVGNGTGAGVSAQVEVDEAPGSGTAVLRVPVDVGACVRSEGISELRLAQSLYEGYVKVFSREPSADRLACAWAHCALEHGRGSHVYFNNLGNITTAGNWPGQTCTKRFTTRVSDDPPQWRVVEQQFRVHDTLEDGAADYWRTMRAHYRRVLDACDAANAVQAAETFHDLGYYTASRQTYIDALPRLYMEALGNVLPKMPRSPWPLRRGSSDNEG